MREQEKAAPTWTLQLSLLIIEKSNQNMVPLRSILKRKRQSYNYDPEVKEAERLSLENFIIGKAGETRPNIHSSYCTFDRREKKPGF